MLKIWLGRILVLMVALMCLRFFVQARYIPSSSMEPTLQIGDRIALERVTHNYERGAIIFFNPPAIEMGSDLSMDPLSILGRVTGLPFFPSDVTFVKRVIGVAGDVIEIRNGVGVYVNNKLLVEPYAKEAPNYDLLVESDIGGRSVLGESIQPYQASNKPIKVPPGMVFVLGDNRNNSEDSHAWGYLALDRITGRGWYIFSPIKESCWAAYWCRTQ